MRLFPVLFCLLLLGACASGKPQYIPPPKPLEPEPVIKAESVESTPAVEVEKPKPVDENSFLAILLKEGTPLENIIPRSKEQVAVYEKGDNLMFYYFKQNRLISQKEFPAVDVELIKAANNYPKVILQELGAIK